MTDCVFCGIAEKKIPAKIIMEDDKVIAFHDINPQAPVHIIIIPREHVSRVSDLSGKNASLAGNLIEAANRLAEEKGIKDKGYRLVINCNEHGGQTVFHLHLHLLGGRPLLWPPG